MCVHCCLLILHFYVLTKDFSGENCEFSTLNLFPFLLSNRPLYGKGWWFQQKNHVFMVEWLMVCMWTFWKGKAHSRELTHLHGRNFWLFPFPFCSCLGHRCNGWYLSSCFVTVKQTGRLNRHIKDDGAEKHKNSGPLLSVDLLFDLLTLC